MWRGDENAGWRHAGDIPAPDFDAVRRWLAPWLDGQTLLGIELMPGGLMNRNCRLHLSDSPDVVLRLYDRDGVSAAKEFAILRLLEGELPVPHVLYAEPDVRDGRPPFLVLELIDGVPLVEIKRSGDLDAMAAAAYDVGRLLARLRTHRFDRAGLLTPALVVDTAPLPDPLTTSSLVDHFATAPAFRARVDDALLGDLRRVARDWDDHPRAPAMPATLVHGDLGSRNILVRQKGGRWSVSAILDWEFAFAGPAYVDIGNFLRNERDERPRFEPHFSRGLRDGGLVLDGDWRQAARMADLPALIELLSRDSTPDDIVAEVLDLVRRSARL